MVWLLGSILTGQMFALESRLGFFMILLPLETISSRLWRPSGKAVPERAGALGSLGCAVVFLVAALGYWHFAG